MPLSLGKKVFHNAREMVKIELFGTKRGKPFVVPIIDNIEKYLGAAIRKSCNRTVMQIAHLRSDGRWLIALKIGRKHGMLLEGRDDEKWWTISFSHGIGRNVKIYILREMMKRNRRFEGSFNEKYILKNVDWLRKIGEEWKKICNRKSRKLLTKVLKGLMQEKLMQEAANRKRWQKNSFVPRAKKIY